MKYLCWKDHTDLTAEVVAEEGPAASNGVVVMGVRFDGLDSVMAALGGEESVKKSIVVTCPTCGSKNVFVVLEPGS